jgi:hypothetical protein
MQLRFRVTRRSAGRPEKGRFFLRVVLGLFLAFFGYSVSIETALPPDAEAAVPASILKTTPKPELRLAGSDEIITGSVSSLFSASVFTGPNRAEKRARAKPELNPVLVASAFDVFRNGLLTMKMPHALGKDAEPGGAAKPSTGSATFAVASIGRDPMTAAYAAIRDALRLDPTPVEMPGALAYARAVAPPSIFDTPVSMRVSEKDFKCLTDAVYFEARGEPYRGQAAVAQVVLNRVKSPLYPNSICAVVYQNQSKRNACQFSFACDGIPEVVNEPDAWKTAKEVAGKVLRGEIYLTEIANATHYHATYVRPDWAREMKRVTQIGGHIFYRFRWAAS